MQLPSRKSFAIPYHISVLGSEPLVELFLLFVDNCLKSGSVHCIIHFLDGCIGIQDTKSDILLIL